MRAFHRRLASLIYDFASPTANMYKPLWRLVMVECVHALVIASPRHGHLLNTMPLFNSRHIAIRASMSHDLLKPVGRVFSDLNYRRVARSATYYYRNELNSNFLCLGDVSRVGASVPYPGAQDGMYECQRPHVKKDTSLRSDYGD